MKVYLSGPIDYVEGHGVEWREYIKDRNEYFNWIDPLDRREEYMGNEWEGIVEWTMEVVKECDAIVVGGWEPGVDTRGTWMEVRSAYEGDVPVILHKSWDGDIPNTVKFHIDGYRESLGGCCIEVIKKGKKKHDIV